MAELGSQRIGTSALGSTDIILDVPKTQLTSSTPSLTIQPGATSFSVNETQLTSTTPNPTVDAVFDLTVPKTQLTSSTPSLTFTPGNAPLNVAETQLTQDTVNPNLIPGTAPLNVSTTELVQTSKNPAVEPGEVNVSVPETQLTVFTEDPGTFNVVNITSPTQALIITPDKYAVMDDQTFKQGDLGDEVEVNLEDSNGAIDLSQAKVELVMEDSTGSKVLDQEMTVTDASNGKVEYQWSPGDPIENTGVYKAEFRITDNAGDTETVPNNGYNSIHVEDDIS